MNPRLASLLAIIALCALYRVLPHPWNVSPVAAMALFAGAHFGSRTLGLAVPVLAMVASDWVLGFHDTMAFVYGALMLTTALGWLLKGHIKALPVLGACLAGSVAFFLITNTGVWLVGSYYPAGIEGLMQSLSAGLPFFQQSLLGNLFFTALLFGGFHALERQFPRLRAQ
ncbi:DUF6580 family putative transport protein [Gallaecimonas sp. GXIMD4217]|uniref:DUF6580 family putative transport protein n=1 Tax=Gallaecimonas sp. GXIMD4217 TaxID=3131927 RepID=UPI00311AF236